MPPRPSAATKLCVDVGTPLAQILCKHVFRDVGVCKGIIGSAAPVSTSSGG